MNRSPLVMVVVATLMTSCAHCAMLRTVNVANGLATARMPAGWSQTQLPGTTAVELVRSGGRIVVLIEPRASHVDAIDRLVQIAAETPGATFLLIDGWPALLRRKTVTVPKHEKGGGRPNRAILVTTAVAVGEILVRAEGAISETMPSVAGEAEAIGRSLVFSVRPDPARAAIDLQRARDAAAQPYVSPIPLSPRGAAGASTIAPGAPSPATSATGGEMEIAAKGNQVVVAAQGGNTLYSNDGGLTFSVSTMNVGFGNNGDPSIARGASDAYYVSLLGTPSGGCSASVLKSAPGNPATFNFVGNGAFCPGTGNPQCFPDQEHIAADPNPSSAGTDQIYMVWRYFTPKFGGNCPTANVNFPTPFLSCSSDGGVTWTSGTPVAGGDRPRVTVGGDGSVWVVFRSHEWIVISKYSSCESGLVPQAGFPKNVQKIFDPECPVPGLDRCEGDMMSSATVATDQTDPNHVYIAFATNYNRSLGNDEIHVVDTTDGFATWPSNGREVIVNGPAVGRRYMPWSCTIGSTVHVGWYDRRAASSTAIDLTAYFRGSASVENGSLVAGGEINLSGVSDPQCAIGFPCGERDLKDNEMCTTPQNDGNCLSNLGPIPPRSGSNIPCRQSAPVCPAGERCLSSNNGCPKYGDYNGIGCTNGHVYAAWASATPPTGLSAPAGIGVFVDARPCGGPGQSCCLSGTSCGTGLTCTAGTCATTACGSVGQPCCAGATPCAAGSGCALGTCTTCPPPSRTLADVTLHAGSNCFGNALTQTIGQLVCDPGMVATCTSTLTSLPNGSTCSASVASGTCLCNISAQTPADCSKRANCRGILTMGVPGPRPAGCPP